MTDTVIPTSHPSGGTRRKRGPRLSGCLPVLVVLALIVGLGYVGVTRGQQAIEDYFADPADYDGPGRGEVAFEVAKGDSVAEIGRNLREEDVVASVEAFIDTAEGDDRATGIQVGYYELRQKMSSTGALAVLVDPGNLVNTTVTVIEGVTLDQILDTLADDTEFPRERFEAVLDEPAKIGLPAYAGGEAEGYLFPSTYAFSPDDTPVTMLRAMVDRWRQAAEDAGLEDAAQRLGYTPHELVTVASLVEAEGRGDDMPKVARVIYNRLENPDTSGTNGLLQIDATVNYALGRNLGVAISEEDLAVDSPYNTRVNPGLPPGPIESPGDAAIAAAASPAEGPWYYYVTVNLRTGETKFSEDYDQFLADKDEYLAYCETSDAC